MDILEAVEFNPEKPSIVIVKKSEAIKMFCVALCKNQVLSKHQARVPSLLIVLKGQIHFLIEGQIINLKEFQTFQIPVNTEHEVLGIQNENLFLLVQELK